MRRNTLGPLNGAPPARAGRPSTASASHMRRASAASSLQKRRESSMAPPAASGAGHRRPSSVAGGRRPPSVAFGGRRADPRPLHDRAFKQACTKDIVSWVLENGYGMPISPQILNNPSSRDFQHIFQFLVRFIDPNFEFRARMEDEIPTLLKRLAYPFTVSKSALSAVGSPHAWPALLGVLTWILELIKYDCANAEREAASAAAVEGGGGRIGAGGLDDEDEDDAHLRAGPVEEEFRPDVVEAVNKSYAEFLRGNDTHPELDREFRDNIERKNAGVRERVAALEGRHAERADSLAAMEAQPDSLQQLQHHRSTLKENIAKFNMLLPSQRDHVAGVNRKLADKAGEVAALEQTCAQHADKTAALQDVLAGQESANIDVQQIARDRANAKELRAKLGAELAAAEEELRVATDGNAADERAIADGLRQYSKVAEAVLVIPETARNAKGTDFRIALADDGASLAVDVDEFVLAGLRALQDDYHRRYVELQGEELSTQDHLDVCEEELMHRRVSVGKLEGRLAKEDGAYKAEKASMAEELGANSQVVARAEEALAERLRRAGERRRESERAVESMASQARMFEENFATERARLAGAVLRQCARTCTHLAGVEREAAAVRAYFAEERARAGEAGAAPGAGDEADGGWDR